MERSAVRQLWVLGATVFVDMVGFLMVVPLMPYYAERFGATPTVVGFLVATFAAAQLLTSPSWGHLSDRYGRRPMLIAGLAISGVAFLLFGLSSSLLMLFVFRFIQGMGGGTVGVVQAYVSDSVPPERRAEALGWISSATSAGVAIGGALGSLTHNLGSWAPGLIASGLCFVNVVSAYLWLPEPQARTKTSSPRRPLRNAMTEVVLHPATPAPALIWVYTVGMMAFMAMNAVLALLLKHRFDLTENEVGYYYSYIGVISVVMRAILLGPLVRRFGELRVMRMGAISLAIGLVAMALAPNISMLAAAVVFVPVGTALLFPSTTALLSRLAPAGQTGQVMGVQQAFGGVSRLVGPIWAGATYQYLGTNAPFLISAALMLGVGGLTRRVAEPQKTSPAEDTPAFLAAEPIEPGAMPPVPTATPQ